MRLSSSHFFLFSEPAPTQIYTLSLHDALPILPTLSILTFANVATPLTAATLVVPASVPPPGLLTIASDPGGGTRSEEHTSELQSHSDLVCRLLLEKKKKINTTLRHGTQHSHHD